MRWVICGVVWILVMSAALLVAAKTKIGPMVARLSQNHGVHVGDLVAVAVGVVIASAVTVVAWVTRPRPDQVAAADPAGLAGTVSPADPANRLS